MRTINLPAATVVCAVIGAFSFPPRVVAEITTPHPETSGSRKAGMEFSPGDGMPGHFRLVCHDVPAYDALTAIAKRRGYELSFDQTAEEACRRVTLNGVYCQPWMGLEGANIEAIIVESISTDAGLPPGQLLRFIRTGKKGPARIAAVSRAALDSNGRVAVFASPKEQLKNSGSKRR